jgi:hypothetical protein
MPPAIPLENPNKTSISWYIAGSFAFPAFAHLSNNKGAYYKLLAYIGQFPTGDGLFGPHHLAYFRGRP